MSSIALVKGGKYTKILAHLGALFTVSCWGSSFVCTKVLMTEGHFSEIEVYTYRFAMAYFFLLLLTFRQIKSNNWRDEFTFFICGICSGTVYFLLENYALAQTTVANVSLLSSMSPIFTTILVAIVFGVSITKGDIVGSLIAFAGVACVILSNATGGLEIHPLGDVLALCAALSWAVYSIMVKKLIPHYSSLFITRKLFFYGVLTSLPFLFLTTKDYHLHLLFDVAANAQYLVNMLFLVVFCSVVSYLIWNEAMKTLGSVTANNYIYLQPPVSMVVGYFMLGEAIMPLGYVGCVLIIGGLILADKWKK